MSNFKGRVKKVTAKQTDLDKTETIVIIGDDTSCEVNCVKVTYPPSLDPSESPVECNYIDTQNGDRIFANDTLSLNSSAPGRTVKLVIKMEDENSNDLGTVNLNVTIEGYNS
jgi:hypothetical protein